MRLALALSVLAVACSDPLPEYDAAVKNFIDVACTGECVADEAACRADLEADFMTARTMLADDNAVSRCAYCLDVKAGLIPDVAACVPTADQNHEVYVACDLDDTMDFDRDGDNTNDDTQACAGFP